MVDIDNTKDAQTTADKVKAADKGGKGADDAYKALNTEVQSHYSQIGQKGYTQADFQKYQDSLVKDLVANGTLPDLSLSWANDNKSILHKLSSKQGDGSGNDLPDNGISHDAIGSTVDLMKGNFNGTLVQAYGAQLENGGDVAGTHINGGTFDAATAATGGDPGHDAYLGPKSTQAYFDQESRAIDNRGLAVKDGDGKTTSKISQLFEGNPPLIQQLDTAKDGGKPDGKVSDGDLDSWLNGHDKNDPNYQVVRDIRDGKYDNQLKKSDGEDKISDGFSVGELSKDLGLPDLEGNIKDGKSSYADFAKAYRDARSGDPVEPPTVVKDANGKPASISYDNGRKDQFEYDANGNINRITETPPEGGTPVVYKANDKGVWGPVKADGTVDDSGGQKNPVITADGQYAFQSKDGKWNVADDHGNFNPPTKDFSYQQGFPKLDKEGNPIPGQVQNSEISVNTGSQITQIKAPDGSISKFTYDTTDPSKLTGFTGIDSKGTPNAFVKDSAGKWVTADADGKPTTTDAPFNDAAIDSAGNVTLTGPDGTKIVSTPDNVNHKDTPDGPVVGADTTQPPSTTDTTAVKLPFDTATDADGNTTFKLEGGQGKWLWNYADQIAKANGKDTQAVLDEIVQANRGRNGIAADATGANVGDYEKGDYIIPKDLLAADSTTTTTTAETDASQPNPPAGDTVPANVTVTDGYVASVKYGDSSSVAFSYDDKHNLNKIQIDGVQGALTYELKDGKWVSSDGSAVPFNNPVVQPDGTLSYTDANGAEMNIAPDAKSA
ncbi:hypothetical protein BH10CYA1_BH10CYA1_34800 [soil metagenome]